MFDFVIIYILKKYIDKKIYQYPIKEIEKLLTAKIDIEIDKIYPYLTYKFYATNIKEDFEIWIKEDGKITY